MAVAQRPIRFLVLGLVALAAFVALVSLGNWQMRRLAWKEALIAAVAERPKLPVLDLPPPGAWGGLDLGNLEYRPFRLTGRFLHDKEAHVFTNLADPHGTFRGPGYWIVTPFALAGGGTVLVNRGFAPQERYLPADRGETLSGEQVTVVGLLRPDDARNLFTPTDKPEKNLFFTRSIGPIVEAKGLDAPVAPFSIDLTASGTPPGGLPQAGETLMRFPNSHLEYALTWYGLAAALALVAVSAAWTRVRAGGRPPAA
ncbi:SURF1 family protein [Propylenella binzhouense]|uniref:SURF1-like protein n=1 Tax=Propylenella binzhouense TaxID=2555902 RepID=A0A964T4W0_9HYPH|nr:SURF1 family protein [Propylenella binzhouense]MYZ48551.1 SURF1 family protein [Propylenella binzhouense]